MAWMAKKELRHFKPLSHPYLVSHPNSPLPLEQTKIKNLYKLSKFIQSKAAAVVALLYPPRSTTTTTRMAKAKRAMPTVRRTSESRRDVGL